jgi:hypothetical protein
MYVNSSKLRKLYGRSQNGTRGRQDIKISMTPETMAMLKQVVPFGGGRYGSAFIELSTRTMIALLGNGEDLDQASVELKNSIESSYFSGNLERLRKLMEA